MWCGGPHAAPIPQVHVLARIPSWIIVAQGCLQLRALCVQLYLDQMETRLAESHTEYQRAFAQEISGCKSMVDQQTVLHGGLKEQVCSTHSLQLLYTSVRRVSPTVYTSQSSQLLIEVCLIRLLSWFVMC